MKRHQVSKNDPCGQWRNISLKTKRRQNVTCFITLSLSDFAISIVTVETLRGKTTSVVCGVALGKARMEGRGVKYET